MFYGVKMEDKILEWVEYTKVNAEVTRATASIVKEVGLSIFINGRHFTTAMIMPTMEKEFVIGYLFGQGVQPAAKTMPTSKEPRYPIGFSLK